MAERSARSRGIGNRVWVAGAVGAGVVGSAVLQRRRLQAIARDPEYRALIAPLGGTELSVHSADGTRLHALVFEPAGAAEPRATVVLAHGWTEELAGWGPVIHRLRAGDGNVRIVAYDLRGHGASDPAAGGDYAIARFGEDVEAVLAAVDAPAAATIVAGHSLGAISIAAWAADHPVADRVAGAALLNTGVDDLIGGSLVLGELGKRLNPRWAGTESIGRALLGSRVPIAPFSTPLQSAVVRYVAFGPTATDAQVAFYERMLTHTKPSARAASGIALSSLHLGSALSQLTVPTLVIAGDRDRLTPPSHARAINAALPSPTRLIELEDTGHMAPLERPAAIGQALAELLARVSHVEPAVR